MSADKMDVKYCKGCDDDFYNGNNPYGVKECWMLKDATLADCRFVHVSQPPPYTSINGHPLRQLPTCYRRTQFVRIKPESLDAKGYWKS